MGSEKAAKVLHTRRRAQRHKREVGWGGGQPSGGPTGILRLKDDSSSPPLGLSSLRTSFFLFRGGVGLSSDVGGSQ